MSLRKGHLRSKVWAPPTLADDWRDQAACTGMMTTDIPLAMCEQCPVTMECAELGATLEAVMQSGRRRNRQAMPGTFGGCNAPEVQDHPSLGNKGGGRYPKGTQPINGGVCAAQDCDRDAYRKGMCSMHYQRMRAEKRGGWR